MRNTFLVTNSNLFGILRYGKLLFLIPLISACFASPLRMIHAGRASSADISTHRGGMTSGDACPTREELIQKTRTLQMPFIANNGQVDEQVRFYAKTFGGTVFVTSEGEIVYAFPNNNNRLASGVRCFESDSSMHNHRCQNPECGTQGNRAWCITEQTSFTPPTVQNGVNEWNVNRRDTAPVSLPRIGLNGVHNLNKYSLFNSLYAYLTTINPSNQISRTTALKETFVGAKIGGITGELPAVTTVNYFTGNDKSKIFV